MFKAKFPPCRGDVSSTFSIKKIKGGGLLYRIECQYSALPLRVLIQFISQWKETFLLCNVYGGLKENLVFIFPKPGPNFCWMANNIFPSYTVQFRTACLEHLLTNLWFVKKSISNFKNHSTLLNNLPVCWVAMLSGSSHHLGLSV